MGAARWTAISSGWRLEVEVAHPGSCGRDGVGRNAGSDGVIDAVLTNVTNAHSEATNAKIQWIKRLGCGYRNRERLRNAIYFHLGELDLYPNALATHTDF